jgi:hypothetical protein
VIESVPDYRDGRDIRAFTPVFDGLPPGRDVVGTAASFALLHRTGGDDDDVEYGKNALVQRDGVLYRGLSHH